MRYAISVNFEGESAVERGADGYRLIGLRGSGEPPESTDMWYLTMHTEPPTQSDARFGAELELVSPLEDHLQAALNHGGADLVSDGSGTAEAWSINFAFDATGGTRGFESATGTVRLHGTVLPQSFRVTADLILDVVAEPWVPPHARLLTAAEDASGSSHVAPQTLTQGSAERDAEERVVRAAAREQPPR